MAERISREAVATVARLANLALTDDELDTYTSQLEAILEHAGVIDGLDLEGVEPTTHAFPLVNVWRDDVPGPTLPRDDVLAMAPDVADRRFSVPPILGEAP